MVVPSAVVPSPSVVVPALSVVVPARDEAANLPALAGRLRAAIPAAFELVIVDDHSVDGTASVARALGAVVVERRDLVPGKGFALLEGFAHSTGELVCMIDADLQYPPEAIPAMVARLSAGADVVVANRVTHGTSAVRRACSRLSYGLLQALHRLNVDVQSGLKVFRRTVLDGVSVRPTGWALDLDLLVAANAAGYRIVGHDVTFVARRYGETKVRLMGTGWQIARRALALRLSPPDGSTMDRVA
ncbi:MAG TPA: glycosyltransferase family 2 protein [Actinophytocola sp.]|jgi:glycosyltransferase involved in cell wall biosynthesis|nr:glycosyltransferase family 2 protein [Actinophytocola sp.]